mgnify:CR=1 FL=1
MAHTKGHITGKSLVKYSTPFKAAYSLGKTALKHPLITAGLFLAHGSKKAKWAKRRKWFDTPLAGKDLKKWYL